ncbi:unnamed protein product [Hyaloperonospora brassicae]|uniref:Glutamate carboxypeptidase n=1 Tax=Hyaloperonospora brassicae TaxID=162125 RepID=A0AAV0TNL5_HYABA|nr:unnamed protein product [Hyaloperonospora brassicae]
MTRASVADSDRRHQEVLDNSPDNTYGTFYGRVTRDGSEGSRLLRRLSVGVVLVVLATFALLGSVARPANTDDAVVNDSDDLTTRRRRFQYETDRHSNRTVGLSTRESSFLDNVDTKQIRTYHRAYASVPHPAGSEQDYQTALFTAEQFASFGIKSEVVTYYPLLSLPLRRHVSIVSPVTAARTLNLTEAAVPGDSCTSDAGALPPYLGYSASGNITASVVYVNYARPVDFQWLKDHSVTLKGKIALIRYGGNFRGLKVMLAEQHGMAGVLIYSDPLDDGYAQGPVYPEGPWRPEGSFQRGSVQYNSIYSGDPLTPGFPSLPGEPYLSKDESKTISHIPGLPLSYGQARYILESLGGMQAPESWQGALQLANGGYFVGDDEGTVVNLDVIMDNSIGPIWDVIGTIEGTEEPDQMVLIGNHRDAWVCGAVDPSSASAVMLEIARGLGDLLEKGWKPRRTLVIASWDGEELGLLGSTEFAEDHAEVLRKQAVAYVNVDNVVGPFVSSGGTPSVAKFLLDTARLIPGNSFYGTDVTENLYEQWVSQTISRRSRHDAGADDGSLAPDHLIQFLGTGTDFTAFYQHLGIISANLGYNFGSAMYGTYHSTMDSIAYVERVGDPHYATHTTMAKWWGLITLRLVDNAIIPFDYSTYGLVMQEDLTQYENATAAMGRNVDYSVLHRAIERFSSDADAFQAHVAEVTQSTTIMKASNKSEIERRVLNQKLASLERYLISGTGLPHRPWFKHMIFGPGFYEGYKGAAFPGISDSIVFDDDNAAIQAHVNDLAVVINAAAEYLMSA